MHIYYMSDPEFGTCQLPSQGETTLDTLRQTGGTAHRHLIHKYVRDGLGNMTMCAGTVMYTAFTKKCENLEVENF